MRRLCLSAIAITLSVISVPAQSDELTECLNRAASAESTEANALAFTRGPDGWLLEVADGKWGKPLSNSRTVSVSCPTAEAREITIPGTGEISDPWYDEETRKLWFVSSIDETGKTSQRDIFSSLWDGNSWSPARPAGDPVNSTSDEYSPVVREGTLWFVSALGGQGDVYRAPLDASGQAQAPEKLPAAINSPFGEWNLWVSEDQTAVLFEASERPSNVSVPGDLYLSTLDVTGHWRPAVPLGPVNSRGSDLNARLVDGQLVWTRAMFGEQARLFSADWSALSALVEQAWQLDLWVAGRSSHAVERWSLELGQVKSRHSTGKGPHLLAMSSDAGDVVAAAYGVYPKPHAEAVTQHTGWVEEVGGAVTRVAISSGISRQFDTGCNRPHGLAWQDRRTLWVSCEDQQGLVRMVFGRDDSVKRTFLATGLEGAHVLAWDDRRQQMLATHTIGGGIWFQPKSGQGEFLELGGGSEAVRVLRDGIRALVGRGPAHELIVLDLDNREVLARVSGNCRFPIDFSEDALGRIWVACFASSTLVELNREDWSYTREIALPAAPLNLEAHPQLPVLYVSLPRQNRVLEWLPDNDGPARSFSAGIEPDGLLLTAAAEEE